LKKYDDDLGNMEDMQNIFKEEEMRNNEDFNKYKQKNYKSSNENDYVRCKKIPQKIDSSLNRCSSKFNTVDKCVYYICICMNR